jgi:hypothetical protein
LVNAVATVDDHQFSPRPVFVGSSNELFIFVAVPSAELQYNRCD